MKNNELNNLIVGLFALADTKISINEEFLNTIDDPFQLLVELMTRSSDFQSFVLSIEENLQFLF